MTTLHEAAQQALEALEWHLEKGAWGADIEGVTAALRERLAQQAEPVEPVAWYFEARHIDSAWAAAVTLKHPGPEGKYMRKVTPLYTAPPQRKPLTEDEVEHLLSTHERNYDMVNFARAIERSHGIGSEHPATLSKPCGSLGEDI